MERVFLKDEIAVEKVQLFLEKQSLTMDLFIEEMYVKKINGKIVATGALYENVLKCIAIDDAYKGSGYINEVIGYLTRRCYELGRMRLFIYTKPQSYRSFEFLGFKKIAQSENVVLMENDLMGIEAFLKKLSRHKKSGHIGSIVMNCNPFTNGHQYLIETASMACDWVHLFILMEEKSTFPNDVRVALVQKGIEHLDNVILHKVSDYIISAATFPSYFLKSDDALTREHVQLDLNIFGEKIAKALEINCRFVGDEPLNKTTAIYNKIMMRQLPKAGIDVIEVPRKEDRLGPISASTVRKLINIEDYGRMSQLVPKSTYDYLLSDAAKPVIEKIKNTYSQENLV